MTDDAAPPTPADADAGAPADAGSDAGSADGGLAPKPRAGFRSRPSGPTWDRAQVFAGMVRAGLGAAGLFASLLYLPIQSATPILAGVSILMMVTGTMSTWRAVRGAPAPINKLPTALVVALSLATFACVALTLIYGAGAFGPVLRAREQAREEARRQAPPSVHFEAVP